MPDDIDQIVRAAADRDVHVARLTTSVMSSLPSQAQAVWMGPGIAAFAALLVATPVAILQFPLVSDEEYAGSFALGDAATLDADLASLFTDEAVE